MEKRRRGTLSGASAVVGLGAAGQWGADWEKADRRGSIHFFGSDLLLYQEPNQPCVCLPLEQARDPS